MAKTKYKFDPDILAFTKYKRSKFEWVIRIFGTISFIILFSFGLYLLAAKYLPTPQEKVLLREIDNYKLNYELLNNKVAHLEKVVTDLENRDENIYRSIFEADPIPKSIRDAGYGGMEKYLQLEGYVGSRTVIEATKRVDKLGKKLYVLSKSYDEIMELASNKEAMLASIPAIQPVKTNNQVRIASGFGWRIHPIYKVVRFHSGIDYIGRSGTPIYATGDGTVIKVEYSRTGYGNMIIVSHGFGYQTLYAHLGKPTVRRGQKVKRGEQIGTIGNTGLSTAPHLHYEVILNNIKLNPVYFFHNDLTPEEYEKVLIIAEQANQALD